MGRPGLRAWVACWAVLHSVGAVPIVALTAQSQTSGASLDATAVRAVATAAADAIAREYFDPSKGTQIAGDLQRRLATGGYDGIVEPERLAQAITRDLYRASSDKHLAVTVSRVATTGNAAAASRADGVHLTNAGVQRVEILPGNVGYLNLTSFWRIDEARDALTAAFALLERADAVIVDLRQNGGGSPDTAAFVVGHFLAGPELLFTIVPREGTPVEYRTPDLPAASRDGKRPLFVLTSARTFSAGEGVAFLLQERGRATVIGEQTPGAANPGRPYVLPGGFEVTVPNGRVRSAWSGGNWEGTGVHPDVAVAASEALESALARARAAVPDRRPAGARR